MALPLVPLPELARLALQQVVSLGVIAACAWGVILATEVLADLVASRYRVDVAANLAVRRIQTQVYVLRRVVTGVVVPLRPGWSLPLARLFAWRRAPAVTAPAPLG
ncbi:MAG TPA: hypothetical protein VNF74_13875 [Terriglobales bacterium]|nr:hypothetical protein [Terriglobales bacterium]